MSAAVTMTGPNAASFAATPSAAENERGTMLFASNWGDDAPLVRRASEGDRAAFRELFERYQRPMASVISRMIPSPDDVDDVLSETFLRAWKGLPRFRGDAQFSTWLYRIAVNTALKHRSRHKNDAAQTVSLAPDEESGLGGLDALPADTDADPMSGGDPFNAVHKQEQERYLRTAVQDLPEKQRSVVLLHYFEGRSCEEISDIVGCSLGTVWSRLHYACKKLRGVLGGAAPARELFEGEVR